MRPSVRPFLETILKGKGMEVILKGAGHVDLNTSQEGQIRVSVSMVQASNIVQIVLSDAVKDGGKPGLFQVIQAVFPIDSFAAVSTSQNNLQLLLDVVHKV